MSEPKRLNIKASSTCWEGKSGQARCHPYTLVSKVMAKNRTPICFYFVIIIFFSLKTHFIDPTQGHESTTSHDISFPTTRYGTTVKMNNNIIDTRIRSSVNDQRVAEDKEKGDAPYLQRVVNFKFILSV